MTGKASIAGHVSDAITGQPIFLGIITWFSKTAYTNANGDYIMETPETGSGKITCERDGYLTAEDWITVNPDESKTVNFSLIPGTPPPTECVKSDFEENIAQCWNYDATGSCYTSDYIKQYCDEKGIRYTLTADLGVVGNMLGPYDAPRTMTYETATAGWEAGYIWLNKFCDHNQKYYFCRYACTLTPG